MGYKKKQAPDQKRAQSTYPINIVHSIIKRMIGYIEGEVGYKDERSFIVLTGGIGYVIFATPSVTSAIAIGERVSLWTHLVVKEDALDLYGFTGRDELTLFRLLIGISGIGPKSALNVLSLADVHTLAHAIASGDGSYLTKVSGIGKKLAEKITLELREKMGNLAEAGAAISRKETEALEALEALGYSPRDTRTLVRTLAQEHATTEDIIRKALQTLGGRPSSP
jgi:Holliday junction DNA helicase RuvA